MIVSFRHDQQRVSRRRRFLAALFVVSLVMFLARVPLSNVLGGLLSTLGAPLWNLRDTLSEKTAQTRALFSSKVVLAEENARLRSEIDAIIVESLSRDTLREENVLLKEQLGRFIGQTVIVARVLSAPGSSPYDTFVIDAGEAHGLSLGMEVYGDGDFVIGEITKVWKESSVVTLYSAPEASVSVSIGTSSIPAIAHGVGGGNFRVTLPKGLPVIPGDLVEMPALSPTYLGVVGGVARPEGSSLQVVFTSLPFNIYQQRLVFVTVPKEALSPEGQRSVTPLP
jgi:cell shape-determining protein MreC